MKECANPDCRKSFQQSKHNQKYCCPECCKAVLNAAVMQQYYNKKARLAGAIRKCSSCLVANLSRYNPTEVCSECVAKEKTQQRKDLLSRLGL